MGGPAASEQASVAESSADPKEKVGRGLFTGPVGPESIVTSGGVVSTVKVRDAGVGSEAPEALLARTRNV